MAIKTVYVSKLGRDFLISPHFKLREFQSKDGADKVLYSEELLAKLEELRAYLGGDDVATVGIPSGYRSPAHNRAVGGASESRHTKGDAADVVCKQNGKRISGKLICALCQTLGFKGVALNKGSGYSVHLDMRPGGTYRGDERKGYGNNVKNGDFYAYFNITKAQVDALRVIPAQEKKEEVEMTQEQFNQMMNVWLSQQAAKEPGEWSKESRAWAEKNVIMTGTGAGFGYGAPATREQVIEFIYRYAKQVDPIK